MLILLVMCFIFACVAAFLLGYEFCYEVHRPKSLGLSINDFAQRIAHREQKKVGVNIAQIMEILRCINDEFESAGMKFYAAIKGEK